MLEEIKLVDEENIGDLLEVLEYGESYYGILLGVMEGWGGIGEYYIVYWGGEEPKNYDRDFGYSSVYGFGDNYFGEYSVSNISLSCREGNNIVYTCK